MLSTEATVRPLEVWRAEYAKNRSVTVPHFDPAEAGVQARVLFLLDSPGKGALPEEGGSGFISVDNDDDAARTCWRERNAAGLHEGVLLWNMVPFRSSGDPPTADEAIAGVKALKPVLRLLPQLEVIVTCGTFATRQWKHHFSHWRKDVFVRGTFSPGRRGMSDEARRADFRSAVAYAKQRAG